MIRRTNRLSLVLGLALAACDGPAEPTQPTDSTVTAVQVAVEAAEIVPGQVVPVSVEVRNRNGAVLPGVAAKLHTLNESIATVTPAGQLLARSIGATSVIAVVDGVADTAAVVVLPLVAAATIDPVSFQLPGRETQVVARLRSADGTELPGRIVRWELSDSSVASIQADGRLSALEIGVTTLRAGSLSGPPLDSIRIEVRAPFTLALGGDQSCALRYDGRAFCWGDNRWGNLGAGSTTPLTFIPLPVAGAFSWSSVVVGRFGTYACGLTTDHAPYCWGVNEGGQLGDGTNTERSAPTPVAGGHHLLMLAAGSLHVCGLDASQAIWCWGYSGENYDFGSKTPVQSGSFPDAIALAADEGVFGLNAGGTLYHWDYGTAPAAPVFSLAFREVAVYSGWGCGIGAADSLVYCWGRDGFEELGNGLGDSPQPTPGPVSGFRHSTSVAVGNSHACARAVTAALLCWGNGYSGQAGPAVFAVAATPATVPGRWYSVAAGDFHTCGLRMDGQVFCWGANSHGQVGSPALADRVGPTQVNLAY